MVIISATNRGSERVSNDFYSTPIDCISNFLDKYGGVEGNILEPSAGCGNIVKILRDKNTNGHITSIELRKEEKDVLSSISDEVIIADFLNWKTDRNFDIIIGNPPYKYAMEFVKKSLELLQENGKLIFLLRTAFLESRSRHDFWQEKPLSELYVLSKRPSFINGKTDATSYSWFVWDKSSKEQKIRVI